MDEIFTEAERQQYRALRIQAEKQLPLSAEEQNQLAALTRRFEEWDAAHLAQVTARIEGETEELRQQNHVLRELLERKRQVAERMEAMLDDLHAEQAMIDAEIARLLSPAEAAELAIGSAR